MMNNVMLIFISVDHYMFINCWLIPFGGFDGGFLGFIGDVNLGLKCTCAESLNRVYQ